MPSLALKTKQDMPRDVAASEKGKGRVSERSSVLDFSSVGLISV